MGFSAKSSLNDSISRVCRSHFNIESPFGYQRILIEEILTACLSEYRENEYKTCGIAILPTGAGKSLCFMLPALLITGYTLIIYPLNALINDQLKRFHESGIPAASLHGGISPKKRNTIAAKAAAG